MYRLSIYGKYVDDSKGKEGTGKMEVDMSVEEVLREIQQLHMNGNPLSKKSIKKSHPQLMRSALYYFPDWDSAIDKSIS